MPSRGLALQQRSRPGAIQGLGAQLRKQLRALTVGQFLVEQQQVGGPCRRVGSRFSSALDLAQFKAWAPSQQLGNHQGLDGVVFDVQHTKAHEPDCAALTFAVVAPDGYAVRPFRC
jgi:hypothetical protein